MNSLLQTAITAALQAGKAILDIYDDPASDFEIEHKADHSPLTIADRYPTRLSETVEKYALSGYQRRKQGHSLCYS